MGTKIEWADITINPLGWGCYGPGGTSQRPNICPYCYAKRISTRSFSGCKMCNEFTPHEHLDRMEKLERMRGRKLIFMQSMGDLFGNWVSDKDIWHVLNGCAKCQNKHIYIFLTKNPERYAKLLHGKDPGLFSNFWFGVTLDGFEMTRRINHREMGDKGKDRMVRFISRFNVFASFEPLIEASALFAMELFKWIIIGGETGNRKGKSTTYPIWVEATVKYCESARKPIFLKNNLREHGYQGELMQQYPFPIPGEPMGGKKICNNIYTR